ncbi:hypothetical protein [Methylococcus sp. EFPC2]|uniref:hypothetical protein n=1 Tax=Methylococcus sp. EFPC2 TaxID=2812648 RepID=UPI001967F08F|nr:hypothetical protein [Methylococcus sp. EFPC2]QSA98623.1 hypothetical protein JWZ97_07470 [Methylococcus sp. EFPC2]
MTSIHSRIKSLEQRHGNTESLRVAITRFSADAELPPPVEQHCVSVTFVKAGQFTDPNQRI